MTLAERAALKAAAENITEFTTEIFQQLASPTVILDLLAENERLRDAIEFAISEGFEWPSDPLTPFVPLEDTP